MTLAADLLPRKGRRGRMEGVASRQKLGRQVTIPTETTRIFTYLPSPPSSAFLSLLRIYIKTGDALSRLSQFPSPIRRHSSFSSPPEDCRRGTRTMQNAPAGPLLPAFFSDGERETHIGSVLVHPSLRFHDLKLNIGRQIGVPPNQLAVFLANRGDPPSWPGRIAVNAKFDFAAAARRQGDGGCFVVVLKRARRERRKDGRDQPAKVPPDNAMLLRRDRSVEIPDQIQPPNQQRLVNGFFPAVADQYRERQAERERDRYLLMRATLDELRRRRMASQRVCEKCEEEKESGCPSAFHCCQNDRVVIGVRAPVGPIARPIRRPEDGATSSVGSSE